MKSGSYLGRSPESLSLSERRQLAGQWIALERYTPLTLPLRRIEALGETPVECMKQLRSRHLDPVRFEYQPIVVE